MSASGRGRSLTRDGLPAGANGRNIFNFTPSPRRLRSPGSPLKQPPWRPAGMPQRRWMTPPNHCSPEPSPRRRSPENTPRQRRQAPQSGPDAEIVLTIRSVFQKSVTEDKVKDFVLGHLSMAGGVPMEAFRITKYQQRPGEIAISMRVRQTDLGSSTEMVRRLAKALEDPKSRLHRPGSLSSRVFTGARMDVVNPGASQRGWTSPMPTRAHSPPVSTGSPEKSSSVGSARRTSREPVVAKPRPPEPQSRGRSAGVLGSGRIVPKPKKAATVAPQVRDKVVGKEGIKEGQQRRVGSIKTPTAARKEESPFLAKLRENILGKPGQPATGPAAVGYGVTVTPAKVLGAGAPPEPTEGVVIKHGDAEQQAANSILEARRGLKQQEVRTPDSPGSLSAASAARNIDIHTDEVEVPVMDTTLWNRTLYGSAAKFAGPVVRSGDATGEGGQAWAVSEVAPYVRGDELIWKCEVSELLGADLTRSAQSTGPGFGVCSAPAEGGKKVDVAMSLVQATLLGYDVDSVCVAGRWVEADKVFKPDWARDLRIEDSITVVAERSAEGLSIFVNGHEVHRQYLKGKMPKSPRLTIDLLGKVAAVRVLPTADVGEALASWPLVRGSQRSSTSSDYKRGIIRTQASVSSRSAATEGRSSRASTQEAVSVASKSASSRASTTQSYTAVSSSIRPERSSAVPQSYTSTNSHPETNTVTQSYRDSRSGRSSLVPSGTGSSSSRLGGSSVTRSYSVSRTASVTHPSRTDPSESSYGSRTGTVTVSSSGQSYETGSVTVTSSATGTAESVTVTESSGYSSRSESVSVSSSSRSDSYSPSVSVSSSGTENASSVSVTSSYVSSYSSTSS
ncbi:hypothetical protein FOL47_006312 [Perkinsus chesapeaki]|uniref:Uncharacterized protein n=1 Tax=Perkinsus chesapeaki TaxID=330153 RepID=A0A7J6MXN3_PERCH|nr:hypothetical protein FOL47_006312 [Perkinsus chesapeaki]